RAIAHARTPGGDEHDAERADDRAGERAPRQRRDAVAPPERRAAGDGAEVVEGRRQRRGHEAAAREQRRRRQPAQIEEELRRQEDARERDRQLEVLGAQLAQVAGGDPRRRELERDDARHDDQRHDGGDDREHVVAARLVILLEVARVDGDEGDRERAAGHDVIEEIGDGEGGVEGVGGAGGAEQRGDDRVAQKAEHARQQDGQDEQRRGEADLLAGGGRGHRLVIRQSRRRARLRAGLPDRRFDAEAGIGRLGVGVVHERELGLDGGLLFEYQLTQRLHQYYPLRRIDRHRLVHVGGALHLEI